ncbi:MAG TPA: CPBP family intramembrane glutamic endopeptidase [Gemmatimonadaceae bacterium]
MPTFVDAVYAAVLIGFMTVYEYKYFWPQFRAAAIADRPGARTHFYRRIVAGEWILTFCALVIWARAHRTWDDIGLAMPHGWRLALGVLVVVLVLALFGAQLWSVLRLPVERRIAARPKLGDVAFMVPRTARDQRWFLTLSITAGFCEELLYRGYLPWLFAPWLGRVGALLFVAALFGAGHLYQGWRGAIRATLVGVFMVTIVLATSSVIPAMIVHALIDIGGGAVGYWLLREYPTHSMPRAAAAPSEAAVET